MSNPIWPLRILGDENVATISSGGTPSRVRPDFFAGDVKWVKSGDLNDAHITNTEETISRLGLNESAAKIVPENSVLIALYGATVGKTGLLKIKAATNQAVCAIQPSPDVFNAQFLQFLLMHIRPQLLNERSGGAQPNISQTIIRNLELPRPEIPEQETIAAMLWKVQRAIEVEEKLIATARELKQSAMRQLFTHGLRNEPQKETDDGIIPKSWVMQSIRTNAKLIAGGTPARGVKEFWTGGTIPWVKTGEVNYCVINDAEEKITPLGLENSAAKILPKGSLLIAMYGQGITRGKVAILGIDAATNQACAGIIPTSDKLKPLFLYYYLTFSYDRLRSFSHGAQQQNLNAELVGSFKVPQADPDEQTEIAVILETIDRKISIHERKRAALSDLFQTLLYQLMTAQIRVDKLDIDTREVENLTGKPESEESK